MTTKVTETRAQTHCPYCHGTENDSLDTRVLEANEDGQVSADYEYTIWVNLYGFIPKLQIESNDFPMETVPITYCPKCGRRLDDRDV